MKYLIVPKHSTDDPKIIVSDNCKLNYSELLDHYQINANGILGAKPRIFIINTEEDIIEELSELDIDDIQEVVRIFA